jgi:superfamily II DNA or RNA helicase
MNQIKGNEYEKQIRDYIIHELHKPAYLWHETPETILVEAGIIGSHNENRLRRIEQKKNPLNDTGIDIIQLEDLDKNICSLVQCKNGYKSGVTMFDLAGFMCWLSAMDHLTGYIYYTNKLSSNLKSLPPNKRIIYIKKEFIVKNEVKFCSATKEFSIEKSSLIPYDYQIDADNVCKKLFEKRGILTLPCGTGKTYISYLFSMNYKKVIFISPLKEFAKQNQMKMIEYGYSKNSLLVDSDGERDIHEIKKFMDENESFLLSSTFCSVDVIYESFKDKIIKQNNDILFIVDEFHNISKTNLMEEENHFYKLLHSECNILFVSATPRIYEMENELDEYHQNEIFGPILYKMTFNEAIEKKYITDYRIWLPSIHENNEELKKELSIYQIESEIKAKCMYLFSCLLNNGSRKCIIYCLNTQEIEDMMIAILLMNDFYSMQIEMNKITCVNNADSRKKILEDFAKNNKIQLLFSVRILDECIDIPSCDSIYITYPSESKIRTIQRLSRCIRILKSNPYKMANIYIWCNDYHEILNTLSGIKEYDMFFKDKIKSLWGVIPTPLKYLGIALIVLLLILLIISFIK